MRTAKQLNDIGARYLPGHPGIVISGVDGAEVRSELAVRELHMAPNGYLHAGTVAVESTV
jgi:acyl-coenzyme A thioesterase PaaI-like protein